MATAVAGCSAWWDPYDDGGAEPFTPAMELPPTTKLSDDCGGDSGFPLAADFVVCPVRRASLDIERAPPLPPLTLARGSGLPAAAPTPTLACRFVGTPAIEDAP